MKPAILKTRFKTGHAMNMAVLEHLTSFNIRLKTAMMSLLLILMSMMMLAMPQSGHAADAVVAEPTAAAVTATAAATVVPTMNKGDIGWMFVATLLVLMMSLPGLALFYGGLVRAKNMLSVLMQTTSIVAIVLILWAVFGYSVAFTEGNAFFGGMGRAFMMGLTPESQAATFSKGVMLPELIYFAFQAVFAAIACALIIGGLVERVKFTALLTFCVFWFALAYLPVAHMVWFWPGPDAFTTEAAATAATNASGYLFALGALDFAGGTVIHINAGVAALVGAIMIGPRIGFRREALTPHSMVMSMIGAGLLWVGWFGFNAGSALEAGSTSALAFINTLLAPAGALLGWSLSEVLTGKRPSLLGAISGLVVGLVVITPACGFVHPMAAIAMGLFGGAVCMFAVSFIKHRFGLDDSLDVFGIHGVGGIIGSLLTGVFANPALGGAGVYDYLTNKIAAYDVWHQLWVQFAGVVITVCWSALVSLILFFIIGKTIGLRVSDDEEREGLDITSHGETAYHH